MCDLPAVMATIDCLVDYKKVCASKFEGIKKSKAKGKISKTSSWKKLKLSFVASKQVKKTTKLVWLTTRTTSYFICNGPHCAEDCPKREKLSTLVNVDSNGDFDSNGPFWVNFY